MNPLKTVMLLAASVSGLVAAVPASATITTFAQYAAIGTGANLMWKNDGSGGTNGTGGSIYTISDAASTVAGARNVRFSFLQGSLAPYISNVVASFTLYASVLNQPAVAGGDFLFQQSIQGSFSFLTTSVLVVGSHSYAVGSNLLSGTFDQSTITGSRNGLSGSLTSSSADGASITYTSEFLSFIPSFGSDLSLALTSITLPLQASPTSGDPTKALRTFKASSTGGFSTDAGAVPEPSMWGLMVLGFGLLGAAMRRRRQVAGA